MTGNVSYLSQQCHGVHVAIYGKPIQICIIMLRSCFTHCLFFYKLFSSLKKLTFHWPFSNMFTSFSWFSGNFGRVKDAGMSHFLDHSI